MAALLDVAGSRQHHRCFLRRVWYEADSNAHDQRFWERALPEALSAGSLVLFDLGLVNYELFALLTERKVGFITRLKKNAVYRVERTLGGGSSSSGGGSSSSGGGSSSGGDQIITLGSAQRRCACALRLVEVPHEGRSYQRAEATST